MLACVRNSAGELMVNFTVSIPEDLKTEMDKYSDVNWSEVTRKSIQAYLLNRKNSFPPLDFEIKEIHVRYDHDLMRPSMSLSFKATNKLDSELIIDRILFKVEFDKEYGRGKLEGAFTGQFLEYQSIIGQGDSNIKITFNPEVDMLRRLSDKMDATFWVYATLTVYVQGFTSPQIKVPPLKVPIDEWKKEVKSALNSYDGDWNKAHTNKSVEVFKCDVHGEFEIVGRKDEQALCPDCGKEAIKIGEYAE